MSLAESPLVKPDNEVVTVAMDDSGFSPTSTPIAQPMYIAPRARMSEKLKSRVRRCVPTFSFLLVACLLLGLVSCAGTIYLAVERSDLIWIGVQAWRIICMATIVLWSYPLAMLITQLIVMLSFRSARTPKLVAVFTYYWISLKWNITYLFVAIIIQIGFTCLFFRNPSTELYLLFQDLLIILTLSMAIYALSAYVCKKIVLHVVSRTTVGKYYQSLTLEGTLLFLAGYRCRFQPEPWYSTTVEELSTRVEWNVKGHPEIKSVLDIPMVQRDRTGRGLAEYIFSVLVPKADEGEMGPRAREAFTLEDLRAHMTAAHKQNATTSAKNTPITAEESFEVLDFTESGKVTLDMLATVVQKCIEDKSNKIKTSTDTQYIVSRVQTMVYSTGAGLDIIVAVFLLGGDSNSLVLATLGVIFGFTFVFGNAAKELFEGTLFVLYAHCYDVGDFITVGTNGPSYFVRKLYLTNTVLETWCGTRLKFPHSQLRNMCIYNHTRSKRSEELFDFMIDVEHATPELLQSVKDVVPSFAKNYPEGVSPQHNVLYRSISEDFKVALRVWIVFVRPNINGSNNKFIAPIVQRVVQVLREHGVKQTTEVGVSRKSDLGNLDALKRIGGGAQ